MAQREKMKPRNLRERFVKLDQFKMLAAFMVTAIHTSPLADISTEADFIFTRVIARTAVPFFFMVTGYFLLPQYLFGHSMDRRPLVRALKKHLRLYLTAILLYLPVNLYAGQFKELSAGGFLRLLLVDGTFYHLWYLPAAVTGVLLVWFLGMRLPFGILTAVSLVLYGVGLFGDSYYGLTAQAPLLKKMYDAVFLVSSYTRNGLFYAPVFLVMGAGIHEVHEKAERKIALQDKKRAPEGLVLCGMGFVLSFGLMAAEALTLRKLDLQRHDSMYVMLPSVMIFLFQLLSAERQSGRKRLREIPLYIYLIHPLCIILVRGAAKTVGVEDLFVKNSLIHYLAVCIVSCGGACIIAAAAQRLRSRREDLGKENYEKGRAWIELSRKNLAKNVEFLQSLLISGQQLMPVLKADAYGHGAVLIAGELQKLGIGAFCVACAAEGVQLRKNGITGDILILGYTHPKDFPLLRKYRLIQTVVDCNYGKVLNHSVRRGGRIRVHVKIDTGMHRLGERAEKTKEISKIFRLSNLKVEGIYTHLCAGETRRPEDMAFTKRQALLFYKVAEQVKSQGYTGLKAHLLASCGLLNYPELGGDFVRVGIALYGLPEGGGVPCLPVLSLRARVAAVKEVYPGEGVGYGWDYVAEDVRKIAVLAIGYGDGLSRSLSERGGRVLIHGISAPVVGRICMDQMMVDITEVPDVREEESATVIGREGDQEITVYELAEKAGTIANEVFSRLGGRLLRIVV